MSPSRGVWGWVWTVAALAALAVPPVHAQGIDEALADVDRDAAFFVRNPRLLAMGRTSLVVQDVHNRLNLWELGNPAGLLGADSTSIVEVGIGTLTGHSEYDMVPTEQVRQDVANGGMAVPYEAWRRAEETVYGLEGAFGSLRTDITYDEDLERRTQFTSPSISPLISGTLPVVRDPRLRYALQFNYAPERIERDFKLITRNGAGDFIDQDGAIVPAPDTFIPLEAQVDVLGGGAWLAYDWGWAAAGAGYRKLQFDTFGVNESPRHRCEVAELRPYQIGQFTLAGKAGMIEWGADARIWDAESEQTWVYTVSAGTAAAPLAGRGRLLNREESGSALGARARWKAGRFEIGAGYEVDNRELNIIAPAIDDLTSFNYFRNRVYGHPGADTLSLPDSIRSQRTEEKSWAGGAGLAWSWSRGLIAVEGRRDEREHENSLGGVGPRVVGFDVRSGVEVRVSERLALRTGYGYRTEDGDEQTEQNEFRGHEFTFGFGLESANRSWGLDVGYSREWANADYGNPQAPRASGQRVATRLRWAI